MKGLWDKDKHDLKDIYQRMNQEMNSAVSDMIDILKGLNPIEVIEYLSIIFYTSFNPAGENEFLQASEMEYVCGLILSRQYQEPYQEFTPDKTQCLLDNIRLFFERWSFTNYSRKIITTECKAEREKQFLLASLAANYGIVRGDALIDQIKKQVLRLFTPFNNWMLKEQGFTIDNILHFIDIIEKRYNRNIEELRDRLVTTAEEIVEETYQHFKTELEQGKVSKKSRKFLRNYKSKKGKQQLINFTICQLFDVEYLGRLVFEIDNLVSDEKITEKNQFSSFIKRFSVEINIDINKDFMYPTDNNIFRQKPIIKSGLKYIIPNYMSLIWILQNELENDMKGSTVWEKYQENKGKYLEQEVIRTFKKVLINCSCYDTLFYYDKDQSGVVNRYELDALIIFDSNLFLIESKSGIFPVQARRGAIKTLQRAINDNIQYAFEQASRARNYISSSKLPIFLNEDNTEKVTIDKEKYSNIFLINVTLENFGEVATQIHLFNKINLYKYSEYPWSVNINDLKIIVDHIEFPTQFIHYIHRRLKINNKESLNAEVLCQDELDLFGQYLETNLFYEDITEFDNIIIPDYTQTFNEYYLSDMTLPKLSQHFDPLFKKLISELELLNQHGYTDIVLRLLDFSSETRNKLLELLQITTDRCLLDRKIHDASFVIYNNPNDPKSGIGLTIMSGFTKDRQELLGKLEGYCKLKKYQQRAYEWIGLIKYVDDPQWTANEFLFFKREEEYDEEIEDISKKLLKKPITPLQKIGRNEPCPCGSGRKYKRCHGK